MPNRKSSPFPSDYGPEVDISPELGPQIAAYYQSLTGVLRWIVELGRVDITFKVSCMASFMAMPQEGHLNALYHMFGYLRVKH